MSVVVVAFVTILLAEMTGDRTLYAIAALTAQHRLAPVVAGVLPALWLKMCVAVLFGGALARIPGPVVTGATVLVFVSMALSALRRARAIVAEAEYAATPWSKSAGSAFAAVALSEWGDPGQFAAATLAASHGHWSLVLLAACLAMTAKAGLAGVLGVGFRRWLPTRTLGHVTAGVCLVLALLTACGLG